MLKFLTRWLCPPDTWDRWVDVPEWYRHPAGGYVVKDVERGSLYYSPNGRAWYSYPNGIRCGLHGAEQSLINDYYRHPLTWRAGLPVWEGP